MPLNINININDAVLEELIAELMLVTGTKTQTEVVHQAPLEQLTAFQSQTPLMERMRSLQVDADRIGLVDPNFNVRDFTDTLTL